MGLTALTYHELLAAGLELQREPSSLVERYRQRFGRLPRRRLGGGGHRIYTERELAVITSPEEWPR